MKRTALTLLIASLAFGQAPADVTRMFHFANVTSQTEMQEITANIRSIAEIRQVSLDAGQATMMLTGSGNQIALAEWMFSEFDKPASPPQPDSATHQYQLAGNPEDVVQVFYLKNPSSVQQLQEVATLLRSIGGIRRLFTYNAMKAIAVRGTSSQIALTGWLVNELDQPADAPTSAQQNRVNTTHEYRPSGTSADVVRVFYLPQTTTVVDFQKIVSYVRTTANIPMAFTYNALRAAALRGTADQLSQAERLIQEKRAASQGVLISGPNTLNVPIR